MNNNKNNGNDTEEEEEVMLNTEICLIIGEFVASYSVGPRFESP